MKMRIETYSSHTWSYKLGCHRDTSGSSWDMPHHSWSWKCKYLTLRWSASIHVQTCMMSLSLPLWWLITHWVAYRRVLFLYILKEAGGTMNEAMRRAFAKSGEIISWRGLEKKSTHVQLMLQVQINCQLCILCKIASCWTEAKFSWIQIKLLEQGIYRKGETNCFRTCGPEWNNFKSMNL